MQRQPLLAQYKQQANPLLLYQCTLYKYTPLVITGNGKNGQVALLSQHKLALTERNTLFCYKIIGAHKKLKNGPVL
jgi:hypothetical protein